MEDLFAHALLEFLAARRTGLSSYFALLWKGRSPGLLLIQLTDYS